MKYIIPILVLSLVLSSCSNRHKYGPFKSYDEQCKYVPPIQYPPLTEEELENYRKEYHPITDELKSNGMNNYTEE